VGYSYLSLFCGVVAAVVARVENTCINVELVQTERQIDRQTKYREQYSCCEYLFDVENSRNGGVFEVDRGSVELPRTQLPIAVAVVRMMVEPVVVVAPRERGGLLDIGIVVSPVVRKGR